MDAGPVEALDLGIGGFGACGYCMDACGVWSLCERAYVPKAWMLGKVSDDGMTGDDGRCQYGVAF